MIKIRDRVSVSAMFRGGATSLWVCSIVVAMARASEDPTTVLGVVVVNNGPVMLGANVTCTATLTLSTPDDDRFYWFVWTHDQTGWAVKQKSKLKSTASLAFNSTKQLGANTMIVYVCSNKYCVPSSIARGQTRFVVTATIPLSVNVSQLNYVGGGNRRVAADDDPPAFSSTWPLYLSGVVHDPDGLLENRDLLYQWLLPDWERNTTDWIVSWPIPSVGLHDVVVNVFAIPPGGIVARAIASAHRASSDVVVPNNGTGSSGFFSVLDPISRLSVAGPRKVSLPYEMTRYGVSCAGTGPITVCWDLGRESEGPVDDGTSGCADVGDGCGHNVTFSFTRPGVYRLEVSGAGRLNSESTRCTVTVTDKDPPTSGMSEGAVIVTIFSVLGLLCAAGVLGVLIHRERTAGRRPNVEVANFDFHVNRDPVPWYKQALMQAQRYWTMSASTKLHDLDVVAPGPPGESTHLFYDSSSSDAL